MDNTKNTDEVVVSLEEAQNQKRKVNNMDTKNQKKIEEVKSFKKKNLIVIGVNLLLSLISIYVFEYWFRSLLNHNLTTLQIVENVGIVVLTALTYFVGKTFYTKGVFNNIKKIFITFGLAAMVLGLMLHSVNSVDQIIYPFSGIIVVSIAFYMLSLTAGTLNMIGIIGLTLLFAAPIAFAKMFDYIDWHTVGSLSKFSIFIILFFGGTWAQIRSYIHGIRGVNKDGGGFGSDNAGDAGDGDGDTGDE